MNYTLENFDKTFLDSNVAQDDLDAITDNQFATTAKIAAGESFIYLKVPTNDVQFFALHNIYGERVKVVLKDSAGNETYTREKAILSSAARTCSDVLLRKRLFVRNSVILEFPMHSNKDGSAEIYIYPYEGEAFCGNIAYGVPTFLGFPEWGWEYGLDAPTLPIIDQSRNLLEDNVIVTYDKSANMVISNFDNGASFEFLDNHLTRLSAKVKELVITGYTYNADGSVDTVNKEQKWVSQKVTWIEPLHSKIVLWGGIESYRFTFNNSVITKLSIKIKGFKR